MPIVCPDKKYARDLCGDQAIYFDPSSSKCSESVNKLHTNLQDGWTPNWSSALKNLNYQRSHYLQTFIHYLPIQKLIFCFNMRHIFFVEQFFWPKLGQVHESRSKLQNTCLMIIMLL